MSGSQELSIELAPLLWYDMRPSRSGGMADTGDLDNLSMPVGNAGMNGVKVGEPFQVVLMATPS